MTGEELLIEERKAVAAKFSKEALCGHKWKVVSEFTKNTRKEVLLVCDMCGAVKTVVLDC